MVVPQPVPPAQPGNDMATCGASALQQVIGLPVRVLPDRGSWSSIRIIHPGEMVTMDYNADRLNVRVDRNGTILQLSCG